MRRILYCTIIGVIASLLLCTEAVAQKSSSYKRLPNGKYVTSKQGASQKNSAQSDLSVGLALGVSVPDGVTAQCAVRLMPQLAIRAGVGFFPKMELYKRTFEFGDAVKQQSYEEALGYTPQLSTKFDYSNLNGQLMLDWHPGGKGFRVSAGVYLGAPKVYAHGMMIDAKTGESIMKKQSTLDPNNMPSITIFDANDDTQRVTIQPSSEAALDATVTLGRVARPYLGIGFGQMAPSDKPVSFFMDLGVLLSGKAQIASPNVTNGDPNLLVDFDPTVQDIVYKAQFLPVINMGLAIRLGGAAK